MVESVRGEAPPSERIDRYRSPEFSVEEAISRDEDLPSS